MVTLDSWNVIPGANKNVCPRVHAGLALTATLLVHDILLQQVPIQNLLCVQAHNTAPQNETMHACSTRQVARSTTQTDLQGFLKILCIASILFKQPGCHVLLPLHQLALFEPQRELSIAVLR